MPSKNPVRVALVSLGCPKNLVDSEKILAHLAEGGCLVAAPLDQADVIVVNTCGFIAPAIEESLGVIREAAGRKARGSARRLVVAGCLVNREGVDLLAEVPEIDALVNLNDRDRILSAVLGRKPSSRRGGTRPDARVRHPESAIRNSLAPSMLSDDGRFRLTPRHTAYLRVSEGCSRRCAFCTIPAIRGPFRSKPREMVLREARELAADGAVEVNVIGQDTTRYGVDLPGRPGLGSLLRDLAAVNGVEWVRLMYAYPRGFDDEAIHAMAECEKIVPYVDLPLQHISDAVLRRMRRATTGKQIETLLDRLQRRIEGLVLRTTFIVGFPGETDADFRELLSFVRRRRFDAVGVFPFYPEAGTPAAKMPAQVDDAVKRQRLESLMLAQQEIAFAANRARLGQTLRVLVDARRGGAAVGRFYGQAPEVDSICRLTRRRTPGRFMDAVVVGSDGYDLVVEPVQR
jgi:ribosomal protein S12 methylthiotransferase